MQYVGSPIREDVRDTLISNKYSALNEIPNGGTVATGSVRRKAQLLSVRPDLKIVPLRGNVDTRIKKLHKNGWDAIIVAAAAIHRLNICDVFIEYLDPNIHVPAPCQGALGIEISNNRKDLINILDTIIDNNTTLCCNAERSFLNRIDDSCSVPVGCSTLIKDKIFFIKGYLSNIDGSNKFIENIKGPITESQNIAIKLAELLLKRINK